MSYIIFQYLEIMEISIKSRYGYELVFRAENVNVEEDIESCIYPKTEDGKTDFSKPPKRDIDTGVIDQFIVVMTDLMYYRVEKYDSCSMIESLFDKLPEDKIQDLLLKLNREYGENE